LSDALRKSIDVDYAGQTYTFRVPGIRRRFEINGRAADIRRKAYPEGIANEQLGLVDNASWNFSRACATFELYLEKATCGWPYGADDMAAIDPATPPKVDWEKFPPEHEDDVEAVWILFETEIARFRAGRNPDGRPAGAQAVDGQPNPG
jgi:hypothetical protein